MFSSNISELFQSKQGWWRLARPARVRRMGTSRGRATCRESRGSRQWVSGQLIRSWRSWQYFPAARQTTVCSKCNGWKNPNPLSTLIFGRSFLKSVFQVRGSHKQSPYQTISLPHNLLPQTMRKQLLSKFRARGKGQNVAWEKNACAHCLMSHNHANFRHSFLLFAPSFLLCFVYLLLHECAIWKHRPCFVKWALGLICILTVNARTFWSMCWNLFRSCISLLRAQAQYLRSQLPK